ncbi:hypothetical protein [Methanosphaera sp. BMS]|nr:hypothetical protein [Methanosphaera sp. BMS]
MTEKRTTKKDWKNYMTGMRKIIVMSQRTNTQTKKDIPPEN